MGHSNKLVKFLGLLGVAGSIAVSPAEAGGHHRPAQPYYLVPMTPVAFPVAYGPAPAGYAQPGHHFKHKAYAYPVAAYASPMTYGYGATPAAASPAAGFGPPATTYNVISYTGNAQTPVAGNGPPPATYQLQWVKTSGGNGSTGASSPVGLGASPDTVLPVLPDLTPDQNDKVRTMLRDHLSTITASASLTDELKKTDMIETAKDYYALELKLSSSTGLSATQSDNASKLAFAILNKPSDSGSQQNGGGNGSGGGGSSSSSSASGGGNYTIQTIQVPAYGPPPAYMQLFLLPPSGGLFHHHKDK